MKWSLKVVIILVSLSLLLISAFKSGGTAEMLGQGNTGAPNDSGNVCASCHGGGSYGFTQQELKLIDPTSMQEVQFYLPGKLYDVEVTVIKGNPGSFPQGYGFQATALGPDTTDIGTWLNPEGVVQVIEITDVLNQPRTYVEHGSPSSSSSFKMQWQAPSSFQDTVRFYFVGNAVNRNFKNTGDNGGFGSNKIFAPQVLESHLVLDIDTVQSGSFAALDSITLSTSLADSSNVILSTSQTIRLLPQTSIPLDASLELVIISND